MRLGGSYAGADHDALTIAQDDHHPRPTSVSFSNTTQSLPPGTTFNLNISLSHTDFQLAKVYMEGPATAGFASSLWRECAIVHVTTATSDAIGHSVRNTGLNYKVYSVTYAKSMGVTNLTHKIFDTVTAAGSRYIALLDAQIISSILRLTFKNYHGGSATLSVKGQALLY